MFTRCNSLDDRLSGHNISMNTDILICKALIVGEHFPVCDLLGDKQLKVPLLILGVYFFCKNCAKGCEMA